MTTKRSGGNITGLLALTVEQTEECEPWTAVHVTGDYEVEPADGTKPILGLVSVGAYGRVGTGLGTSVGNPIVPGQITVEAIGLMVRRLTLGGTVAAGVEVGVNADNEIVAFTTAYDGGGEDPITVTTSGAAVGLALMGGDDGDDIDVLVR